MTYEPSDADIRELAGLLTDWRYPRGLWVDGHTPPDEASDDEVAERLLRSDWLAGRRAAPATVTPSRDEYRVGVKRAMAALTNASETSEMRNRDAYGILDALAAPPASTTTEPANPALRCTCPSGDGSLRWPCPSHPPTEDKG